VFHSNEFTLYIWSQGLFAQLVIYLDQLLRDNDDQYAGYEEGPKKFLLLAIQSLVVHKDMNTEETILIVLQTL
jgi:hypothetical protein